jgi:hypothetical protein
MLHKGQVIPKFKLRGLMTMVISFSLFFLINLYKKPFIFPAGWPLCAVAEDWCLRILSIRKIITTKIFVKTVCPGLRLIVQLMHAVEGFGIWDHPLALKGPDKGVEPNNSVRSQLMKIYFEVL